MTRLLCALSSIVLWVSQPWSNAAAQTPSSYSLVANRLAAHQGRDKQLVIPATDAHFVKYLRFARDKVPWTFGQKREGKAAAILTERSADLSFPLRSDQVSSTGRISLRVHAQGAGALTVTVNGGSQIHRQLPAGWSDVSIPASGLKVGENQLRLLTPRASSLALAHIAIGGDGPVPEPWSEGQAQVLSIPRQAHLDYYIVLPPAASFKAGTVEGSCAPRLSVSADARKLMEVSLKSSTPVDLSSFGDQAVRLSVLAGACDGVRLHAPVVATAPAKVARSKGVAKPKYVVLWVMDSLRADKVKTFNPGARAATPSFDKLAVRSAIFTSAYVTGNESRVSHASLFSATYPAVHGFYNPKTKLAPKFQTVGKTATQAGLATIGVSANGYVDPRWGFGRGWTAFHNHIHEKKGLRGENLLERALEFIRDRKTPWLLYLGTIDTHVGWRAKEPWINQYAASGYRGRFAKTFSGEDANRAASGSLKVTEQDISHIRALYDSNVSYQDQLLGKLVEHLQTRGILDETLLIVVADHGDEIFERGRQGHGRGLRESVVHVPLLVHYPPLFGAARIDRPVDIVDILPTIADALGVAAHDTWQGESLFAVANQPRTPAMALSSEYERRHAARQGQLKLVASGASPPELYDLSRDPEEDKDVSAERPMAVRALSDSLWILRAWNQRWNKHRWGNPANVTDRFAAEVLQ